MVQDALWSTAQTAPLSPSLTIVLCWLILGIKLTGPQKNQISCETYSFYAVCLWTGGLVDCLPDVGGHHLTRAGPEPGDTEVEESWILGGSDCMSQDLSPVPCPRAGIYTISFAHACGLKFTSLAFLGLQLTDSRFWTCQPLCNLMRPQFLKINLILCVCVCIYTVTYIHIYVCIYVCKKYI